MSESAGIAVMKMAMNTGKENSSQMAQMIENNVAVDSNLGSHIDVSA